MVNKQTALSGSQIHTSGSAGGQVIIKEKSIVVKDDIPVPHKIALREIKKDGVVLSTVIRSVMQPRISDVRLRICM